MAKTPNVTIPHEVVSLMLEDGVTPTRAWRTYLGVSCTQMAERLDMTEAAYALIESAPTLSGPILEKIAAALGVAAAQLDV